MGVYPKWMVLKRNPIKMDCLGVPPFMETSASHQHFIFQYWDWVKLEGSLVAQLRRATIVCTTEASVWVLDRDLAERSERPWRYHEDTISVADFNP